MWDWRLGQKIVCINDTFVGISEKILPVKGRVYTIRGIYDDDIGSIAFLLHEIVNEKRDNFIGYEGQLLEPGFFATRFRPVTTKKTSIDVFTAMLKPTDEMV